MKKLCLFALLAWLFSTSFVFAQEDKEAIKKRLQNVYVQFLKEEGFVPTVDDDGDVKFKSEGDTYYLQPTGEPTFMALSRFLSNTDKTHDLKIYQAMDKTNREYKVVKLYLSESYSNLVIQASNYLSDEDGFKKIFYRCMKRIKNAEEFFKDEYNK